MSPLQIPPSSFRECLLEPKQNVFVCLCALPPKATAVHHVGVAPVGAIEREKRKKEVATNKQTNIYFISDMLGGISHE